ncbi:Pilus specific extracellular protein [Lacticaseibacillus paracasei]|nr:Pilus specific extracellular protein [Lacticaseibacillus paracasei]
MLPKTGGNGIVLFLLMALVAGASGLLLAIVLKRKEAR